MAKLHDEIARMEAILAGPRQGRSGLELGAMEEDLARCRHIMDLWEEFGDIPMDPETECIEQPFSPRYQHSERIRTSFPAGTFREDIWHWFESEFSISVAEDLMY